MKTNAVNDLPKTERSLEITGARLSAGAGFVVLECGNIRAMPGLPRRPAAERIRIADDGQIEGLS